MLFGSRYIVMKMIEQKKIAILKFYPDGKARIIRVIDTLWSQLYVYLNNEEQRKIILGHSKMYDWRRKEIEEEK